MRNLIVGFAIILVALVFAAMPILFAGKGLLFTLAAGHPNASSRATTIAAAALVFAFGSILWRQVVYGAAH